MSLQPLTYKLPFRTRSPTVLATGTVTFDNSAGASPTTIVQTVFVWMPKEPKEVLILAPSSDPGAKVWVSGKTPFSIDFTAVVDAGVTATFTYIAIG